MNKSLYDILGVDKNASGDKIRRTYRELARKYHPDVNQDNKKSTEKFKRIAAAYEVLSDAQKRKHYDEFGEESLQGGFDPEKAKAYNRWKKSRSQGAQPFQDYGSGVRDNFADMFGFGAGFGQRQARPKRGADIRATVEMDLAQAISGGEVTVEIPNSKPVTIRIPPGADHGSTIRIKGQGAAGQGNQSRGDLLIDTHVRSHPLLKREGLDLHMIVPVTLDEAYNGGTIDIPSFTGAIKLRVPSHSQSGTRLRVRGKGVKRGAKTGDLIIELQLRMPDKHDAHLAEAITQSQSAYSIPIRQDIRL